MNNAKGDELPQGVQAGIGLCALLFFGWVVSFFIDEPGGQDGTISHKLKSGYWLCFSEPAWDQFNDGMLHEKFSASWQMIDEGLCSPTTDYSDFEFSLVDVGVGTTVVRFRLPSGVNIDAWTNTEAAVKL